MGKIKDVLYKRIDPSIYSPEEAANFYFYYNTLGLDDSLMNAYIETETEQLNLRNRLLSQSIKDKEIDRSLNITNNILAISSMSDHVVIITEI